jgi:hypothetical protein
MTLHEEIAEVRRAARAFFDAVLESVRPPSSAAKRIIGEALLGQVARGLTKAETASLIMDMLDEVYRRRLAFGRLITVPIMTAAFLALLFLAAS